MASGAEEDRAELIAWVPAALVFLGIVAVSLAPNWDSGLPGPKHPPRSAPWSGGAYFRLIPYPFFGRGVVAKLRATSWFMFYLHPWELDADEAPLPGMSAFRRVRAYAGRRRHDNVRRLRRSHDGAVAIGLYS